MISASIPHPPSTHHSPLITRPFLFVVLLAFLIQPLYAGWTPPIRIDSLFTAMVDSADSNAHFGLSVYSPRDAGFLLDVDADSSFIPASTLKLLTTAAVMDAFAPDYRPQTRLRLEGSLQGKIFRGRLVIVGEGDPNISGRYTGDALDPLRHWVDSLRAMGIDTITGKILTDTSFYPDPRRPSTWKKEFFDYWYGAEVSALTFNDNCLLLKVHPGDSMGDTVKVEINPATGILEVENLATTGRRRRNRLKWILDEKENRIKIEGTLGIRSGGAARTVPLRRPAEYLLAAFRIAAADRGLVLLEKEPAENLPLYGELHFGTVPLLSILSEINQRSQNLHAEMMLRNLGALRSGTASLENGRAAVFAFLHSLGIDTTGFRMLDGSGLSAENRVTPKGVVKLIAKMIRHPRADLFIRSLAIPGITGKRLRHLELAHRVRFKTGFINQVQGLAGFIRSSDGDTLAVAMYLNDYTMRDQEARDLIDTLWTSLTRTFNIEFKSLKAARKLWQDHDKSQNTLERLDTFSTLLMGRPYLLGPTGEGFRGQVERGPLLETASFDCVTYIETALALARAQSQDSILSELLLIRYVNEKVSYKTRKHYFVEDWLYKSPDIVRPFRFPGDTTATRSTGKKAFYKSKNMVWSKENPKTLLHYLPFDSAVVLLENWDTTSTRFLGVGFVGKYPSLWVTHTGFFVAKKGKQPVLRHAGSKRKVVFEENFLDYLRSRKKSIIGLTFFEFIEKS